jgi:hypothetical protein
MQDLWNFKVKIPEAKLKSRKTNTLPETKKIKSREKIKFQNLWNFKVKIPQEKLKSRKKTIKSR